MFTAECYTSGEVRLIEYDINSYIDPRVHRTFRELSEYFATISSRSLAVQEMHTRSLNILLRGVRDVTHSTYVAVLLSRPCEQMGCELQVVASVARTKKYDKVSPEAHPNNMKMVMPDPNAPNLFVRPFVKRLPILTNTVMSDPRLGCTIPTHHLEMRTFLGVPIICDTQCIGQLVCVNAKMYTVNTLKKLSPLTHLINSTVKSMEQNELNDSQITEVEDLKHNFLATMSHEIRTPLSGAVGMISLLKDAGQLNEQQRSYISRALNCCCQLMEIINDILDYSKMQSHTLVLSEEPFNIRNCVIESVDLVLPRAEAKMVTVRTDIDVQVPNIVYGDPKRLRQILINLLSNAVKFTNEGTIDIRLRVERVDETIYTIRFEVQDTGIGIAVKDQQKIFNVFEQISNELISHDEPSRTGTGLGLAICRELARLMYSDIYVKSDGVGTGSTFYFTLDMQAEMTETQLRHISSTHMDPSSIHVMVVDDNMDNRMILSGFMHKWGMRSTVCASATEVLHNLRLGKHYDVAVVDVCMPKISGIELAQTLRKEFPTLPVIALSSREIESKGRVWFDAFFIKPLNNIKLYRAIMQACSGEKSLSVPAVKKCPIGELRVCVCEDDSNNQFVITEMLKQIGVHGSNIHVVGNGKLAIQKCMHNQFDVCFMDLRMPIIDGFEASKRIKTLTGCPSIIVVSASMLEEDKQRISEIGVDGYITKPFDKSDLQNVISRYVD